MALPLVAGALGALGSFLGGRSQAKANRYAAELEQKRYEQTREDLAPYRDGGAMGLETYLKELGFRDGTYTAPQGPNMDLDAIGAGYQASPGYQYALEQGQRAIERSRAARGLAQSGGALKELQRHAMGLQNQDYYNYVDQKRQGLQQNYNIDQARLSVLGGLADMGQSSSSLTGNFGANAAANASRAIQAGGAAMGQAYADAGRSLSDGLMHYWKYNQSSR